MYEKKNENKQKTVRKYKKTSSRGLNCRGRKQFKQISEAFEMRIQIISSVVLFFCHLCDEPEGIGHEKSNQQRTFFTRFFIT